MLRIGGKDDFSRKSTVAHFMGRCLETFEDLFHCNVVFVARDSSSHAGTQDGRGSLERDSRVEVPLNRRHARFSINIDFANSV